MVKLTGPIHSHKATGKLADSLIFSAAKSNAYLKRNTKPKNPKTEKQTSTRAMVKFLSQNWKPLTPADKLTWDGLAYQTHVSPYHAFIAENMKRWKTFRAPSKAYPAAEALPTPGVTYQSAYDGIASIDLTFVSGGGQKPWGYATFRQPAAFPAPTQQMLVIVTARIPVGFTSARDTPLEPGTYTYRTLGFTEDGVMRWTSSPDTATAT